MALTPMQAHGKARPATTAADAHVIWHDLECGHYTADLPLWRELAAAYPSGPILDIGAGTGRVALDLALTGREVIALDQDAKLLERLRERDRAGSIRTVCADARDFSLDLDQGIDLALVPMQTVQLLGGAPQRAGLLRSVRKHLRPGGLMACALVTELEPFDCRAGGPAPRPERLHLEHSVFSSHAVLVEPGPERIRIERERRISPITGSNEDSAVEPSLEHNVVELDRVSARELEREAAAAGLRAEAPRTIAPTAEHTGSTVVMLRA